MYTGSNLPPMSLTIMHDLNIVPIEQNKYEGYTGVMRTIQLNNKEYRVWYYVPNEYILSEVRVTKNVNGKVVSERASVKEVRDNPSILLTDHKFLHNLKQTIVKMKNYACAYGLGQDQAFRSLALVGDNVNFKYFDQKTRTFSTVTKEALESLNSKLENPELDLQMENLLNILKEEVLEKVMNAAAKMQTSLSNRPEAEIEYIKNVRDQTYETKVFAPVPDPEIDPDLDGFKVVNDNPLTDQAEKAMDELEENVIVPQKEISFWTRFKFLITGNEALVAQEKFRKRQDARDNEAKAKVPAAAKQERRLNDEPEKELIEPPMNEREKSESEGLRLVKLKDAKNSSHDSMPDVVPRDFIKAKDSAPPPPPAPKNELPIQNEAAKANVIPPKVAVAVPPPPPPPPSPPLQDDGAAAASKPAEKPVPLKKAAAKVNAENDEQPQEGSSGDLLSQIKGGAKLKPVGKPEAKSKPQVAESLQDAVLKAVAKKRAAHHQPEDDKPAENFEV